MLGQRTGKQRAGGAALAPVTTAQSARSCRQQCSPATSRPTAANNKPRARQCSVFDHHARKEAKSLHCERRGGVARLPAKKHEMAGEMAGERGKFSCNAKARRGSRSRGGSSWRNWWLCVCPKKGGCVMRRRSCVVVVVIIRELPTPSYSFFN